MNDGAWVAWLRTRLTPGMTFVDIGAHQGAYTGMARAAVGPAGAVYAVEPDPRETGRLTDLGVTVIDLALGDQSHSADFWVDDADGAQSTLYPGAQDSQHPGHTVLVPVRTIDGLVMAGRLPAFPDFVKLDTQGAEIPILRAALSWRRRPMMGWLVEVWPAGWAAAGAEVADLERLFDPSGFQPFVLERGEVATVIAWAELAQQVKRFGSSRRALNVGLAVPGWPWWPK